MLFFMLSVRVVPIMRTLEERSLRTDLTRVPCIYSIEFRRKRSVYLVSHTLKKYALSRDKPFIALRQFMIFFESSPTEMAFQI